MWRSFRRVIVVVLAGGVLWSCGSEAPEEIAVGVVVSLTGPMESERQAIEELTASKMAL